jgi:hypothetical protein
MALFLATGTIEKSWYMGDTTKEPVTRLVEAEDEHEAVKKFVAHFESKTREYSVYYNVWDACVHEVIK